jgi:hypothetical protein
MCTGGNSTEDDAMARQAACAAPGSIAAALAMAEAGLDYLNSPAAADLDATAIGEVLITLGELQAKHAAVRAQLLRRFDAADAHAADGYGSTAAWLAARTQMPRKAAKAAMREARQLTGHGDVLAAMADGEIPESLGLAIADWTRKLPHELRGETDKILLEAAGAGASPDDLAVLATAAYEKWRGQHPDEDEESRFRDRHVQLGITFGGAAYLKGGLTPECAAAVRAMLEALGKKEGPQDERTEQQRSHDALQFGSELLMRAGLLPDRAGADTQVAKSPIQHAVATA